MSIKAGKHEPVYRVLDPEATWVDTGVDVPVGALLRIVASGSVAIDPNFAISMSPDGCVGTSDGPLGAFIVPGFACWSLVGRVGDGAPFEVGAKFSGNLPSGRLYLGVNDASFDDNAGAFRVAVRRVHP